MIYIFENLIPIILATATAFAFGAVYYMLVGKSWMAAANLTEDKLKGPDGKTSPMPFVIALFAELWMAAILAGALILSPTDAGMWTMTIGTALIIWIGFVVPTMVVNHRYQMLPWKLTLIDGGHWLGVMLVQAIVLRFVGLELPA